MISVKMPPAGQLLKKILLLSLLSLPINTIGCSHYVVVPGDEKIQISAQQWDQMRADNELLINELSRCKERRQ